MSGKGDHVSLSFCNESVALFYRLFCSLGLPNTKYWIKQPELGGITYIFINRLECIDCKMYCKILDKYKEKKQFLTIMVKLFECFFVTKLQLLKNIKKLNSTIFAKALILILYLQNCFRRLTTILIRFNSVKKHTVLKKSRDTASFNNKSKGV